MDMWCGMNPGGGVAESRREEDPLTCHTDCWWVDSVFFVSSCGSPQSEESFMLKREEEPRIWVCGEKCTLPFVGSNDQG